MAPTTREGALNLLENVGGLSKEEKVVLFNLLAREDDHLVVRLFSTPSAYLEETLRKYVEEKRSTGTSLDSLVAEVREVRSSMGQLLTIIPTVLYPSFVGLFPKSGSKGSQSTSEKKEGWRDVAFDFYGSYDEDLRRQNKRWVLCCATGMYVGESFVQAGHILPRVANGEVNTFMILLGLTDIHDPRNLVPWVKPVEEAWTAMGFVVDHRFRLLVIDEDLRDQEVWSYGSKLNPKEKENLKATIGTVTFGQLDGQELTFGNANKPYQRCFVFMMRAALVVRKIRGQEISFKSKLDEALATSPTFEGRDRLNSYMAAMDGARMAEVGSLYPYSPIDEAQPMD